SEKFGVCPYEMSLILAKKAKVIVGDYFYLFSPSVSTSFLKKSGIEMENVIIVVDEAHNLPSRVKDLYSNKLTNVILRRAVAEAKKYKFDEIGSVLEEIKDVLDKLSDFDGEEKYISKMDFYERVNYATDYEQLVDDLSEIADSVREKQKNSYIGSVSLFLELWKNDDEGFTRIVSKQEGPKDIIKTINFRCLDPGIFTRNVIESAHSTILMSGTLTPTSMYKELLGFDEAEEETYESPFPEENKLNIIIPKTSTKYDLRSQQQYSDIADILAKVVNKVPGNSAVFFPSYYLRDRIYKEFNELCNKTVFIEHPNMSKSEKQELLEKFKSYKKTGAVLLGVISGSFGEGIDLPGDYLKSVVIVGLPLTKPDLETKALIDYFDKKFGKGWDYGYLFPAFNKTLQSAGRCIRSETDKGVIIFLDERYTWNNYHRCFPSSWNIKTTMLYEKMIEQFFENSS
ncbi:ATP-dependent DNA helicase, partial [Bacteroidota bacterium]